ncbi:hypothetical protein JD844_022903 [Phrynosoma platyrhinos]|uniref:Metaxin 2 n=1 Tax=Phrynosoma platyrhinos TaxID=52577 RepID=A0ABQ7SW91_PHRPL|nr:hypothetical protein JD844_022903 [Phrynosoma platyrhinos]
MCNLPVQVVCTANAEYMSPSGKVPFIHVGSQVVSELGPIVQFVKAKSVDLDHFSGNLELETKVSQKSSSPLEFAFRPERSLHAAFSPIGWGHSLSDGLDEVQKAEMKAYMELVNNMLLTAELYLQWCDDATVQEITHPRYGSPYPWPLNHILAYQKQWEVRRKMKAIGWGNKSLDQGKDLGEQESAGVKTSYYCLMISHAVCLHCLSCLLRPLSAITPGSEQNLGNHFVLLYQCWNLRAFEKRKPKQLLPTELDALVFGHLFTILTTQLISDELSEKVKGYSNLIAFCRRIEQHYFEGHNKDISARLPSPTLRQTLRS